MLRDQIFLFKIVVMATAEAAALAMEAATMATGGLKLPPSSFTKTVSIWSKSLKMAARLIFAILFGDFGQYNDSVREVRPQ